MKKKNYEMPVIKTVELKPTFILAGSDTSLSASGSIDDADNGGDVGDDVFSF